MRELIKVLLSIFDILKRHMENRRTTKRVYEGMCIKNSPMAECENGELIQSVKD